MVAVWAVLQHAPVMVMATLQTIMIGMVVVQVVLRHAPAMVVTPQIIMIDMEAALARQRPAPAMVEVLPQHIMMLTAIVSDQVSAGNR